MQGQLFTQDFLSRGITDTEPWRSLTDEDLAGFRTKVAAIFNSINLTTVLNESQTESLLIEPVLDLLGWGESWLSQVNMSVKGREDVPDFLLFPSHTKKALAIAEPSEDRRIRHGIALVEAKRWGRPLDRKDDAPSLAIKPRDFGAPSSQMLRYLSRADVMSDRTVKWGVLTNGAVWRLYWQDARSRAEDFFEIDLAALIELPGTQLELEGVTVAHGLKLFYLLFCRAAFLPQDWDTSQRTFHAVALTEARLYEEKVSESLGERVFTEVFPELATALAASDLEAQIDEDGKYTRAYLDQLGEASLIFMYRLLFVFYAEDRYLLPVRDERYREYSGRTIRDEIGDKRDRGSTFSKTVSNFWGRLESLFTMIADGDDAVGMPAYNGGLFDRARAPILARARMPDAQLAPIIDALSRRTEDILRPRINYRDLAVSHLGGIYERLLEFRLVQEGKLLAARPSTFARKVSGSYYTHDALVRLILDEAVGRLVQERRDEFDKQLLAFANRKSLKPYEWDALEKVDPATQLLELKVCDPAMGSGHFLVALVDWLADRVLESIQVVDDAVNGKVWAAHLADRGAPYASPVVTRLADIRQRILSAAKAHKWALDERQLDDRHIVRRMILKKVIFGVDKNPMAVELAKVALWLHTFTVGAPLSFLDHHLQCGDSLHGEQLKSVRKELEDLGVLFQEQELTKLAESAGNLERVADLTDTSIAEAHQSKQLSDDAYESIRPILSLLSFWRALRWLVPKWPTNRISKIADETLRTGLAELFSGRHNLAAIVAFGRLPGRGKDVDAANALLSEAARLSEGERFFHWWTAFPTVWRNGVGGFDAIIGNPPWAPVKLQKIRWFEARDPKIAAALNSSERKKLIEALEQQGANLYREYQRAARHAELFAEVARDANDFPLLSGGDVNLYELFTERAAALVRSNGVVALLVPSGIVADLNSSDFLLHMAKEKRIGVVFDFENRKEFFPDVHASQKFCAFVIGGEHRTFSDVKCAFYLHDVRELDTPDRILNLSASDFQAVNPNTGAIPILRSQLDFSLLMRAHRTHPVLVRKLGSSVEQVWPVKHRRVLDMSSDSALFYDAQKLLQLGIEDPSGAAGRAAGWLPLYEGKLVQMYDHRAASVRLNMSNVKRQSIPVATNEYQHQDPTYSIKPLYWVRDTETGNPPDTRFALAFKKITGATNARTMIAALLPNGGYGDSLPVLLPDNCSPSEYATAASILLANLNSLALDYFLRLKCQGINLNWFIVEQLPVIARERFSERIGQEVISEFVLAEVLALSYNSESMAPYAVAMGHVDAQGNAKPPFIWDSEDRVHRMARLDALFMYLYQITLEEAKYILSTFSAFHENDSVLLSPNRTRDLILGYMVQIQRGQLTHQNLEL